MLPVKKNLDDDLNLKISIMESRLNDALNTFNPTKGKNNKNIYGILNNLKSDFIGD